MKFQCPSCKASYQLADERVAGKILQIKCRRCAAMIEVVGDPSLTAAPVSKPGGYAGASAQAPPSGSGLPTATPEDGADDDEETAIMRFPPRGLVPPRATAQKPAAAGGTGPAASNPQAPPARAPLSGLGRMTFRAPVAPSGAAAPPRAEPAALPRPSASGPRGAPAATADAPAAAADPAASVSDATLPSPGTDKLPLIAAPASAASAKALPALGGVPSPAASKPLFPPGAGSPGAAGKAAPASPARPTPVASSLGARPARPVFGGGKTLLGLPPPPAPLAAGSAPAAVSTPAAVPGASPPQIGPVAGSSEAAPGQWFVEISGSRVGPLERQAIREKLLEGVVTGESMLWREGLTDWQHLKNMPEFADWLREAQLRRAPSDLGAPPRAASPPAAAVAMFAPAASAGAADLAGQAAALPARPPEAPLEVMADPFATPPPQPVAAAAGAASNPAESAAPGREAQANGLALAAANAALPVDQPPPSIAEPLRAPRKRGMPFMAYVFVALAAGFGGVGAYVLLTRQPSPVPGQPQIVYVSAPVPPGAAPAGTAPVEAAQAPNLPAGPEATDPAQIAGKGGTKAGPLRAGDPKGAASAGPAVPLDMSGFANTGVTGPSAEGPTTAGAQAAGGKLSEGEMNGVVAQNKPLVHRRCWQPALDSRSGTGATSARVVASLVIGPAGNVQQVSASGAEKAFPGLASCIAGRVKTWKFPASGGTTQVNVPFVFAAQ